MKFTTLIALCAGLAAANPGYGSSPKPGKCGKVDAILTGLPPNHPLVISQGFNPTAVNNGLRADQAMILAAGYNLRVYLSGPEVPIDGLAEQIKGTRWEATGVGYGVRGSSYLNLTIRLEEDIATFRKYAPESVIVFNRSPVTTLEALQRNVPIAENCTEAGIKGKDLGFIIKCDPTVCTQPY